MRAAVTFWSIQHSAVVEQIRQRGYLRADGRRVFAWSRPAYRWMAGQMVVRIGRPSRGSRYPLWMWERFHGDRRRPDLRSTSLLPRGTPGVLLEIEKPEDEVLLSDFQKWHCVLNRSYLPLSMAEMKRFERASGEMVIDPLAGTGPRLLRETMLRSWERVFAFPAKASDAWEAPEEREVQATCWEIREDEILSITFFVAR